MSSNQVVITAISVLHFVAPLVSFVYFALASIWSICALQALDSHVHGKLQSFVLATTAAILVSCVSLSSG